MTGNNIVGGTTVLGGGIMNQANVRLVLNDCIVSGNSVSGTANAHGGGIYNFGTNIDALRVNRSTISRQHRSHPPAARAGAEITTVVSAPSSTARSAATARNGPHGGGGIYHQSVGEPLALINTTIANNTASGGGTGGGIYEENSLSGASKFPF